MSAQLIERLTSTQVYSGRDLRASLRPYDAPKDTATKKARVILVSLETRDAIVAALGKQGDAI